MSTKVSAKLGDVINRRYDFRFICDVADGNPNGDPDADNSPRQDPFTNQGLITDVCIKRKIRDTAFRLANRNGPKPGYRLFFQNQNARFEDRVLNEINREAYEACGFKKDEEKNPKAQYDQVEKAKKWLCDNMFDIRAFGAVMSTKGHNCGQVQGPIQLTFSRSVDVITPLTMKITRKSVTTIDDAVSQAQKDGTLTGTMGTKHIVPYAVYVGSGYVNAFRAADTGFTNADLLLFFEAMGRMFDFDRSATRGTMSLRKLVVFEHENPLGNAHDYDLFERIRIPALGRNNTARSFAEYQLTVDKTNLPDGIAVWEFPDDLSRFKAQFA